MPGPDEVSHERSERDLELTDEQLDERAEKEYVVVAIKT
jgi:hypothetical protein